MIKKFLALMVLTVGLSVNACWFTALNYDKCYIAKINTTVVYDDSATNVSYIVSYRGGICGLNGVFTYISPSEYGGNFNRTLRRSESGLWGIHDGVYYAFDSSFSYGAARPPTGIYTTTTAGLDYFPANFNVNLYEAVQPPAGTQDLPCQVWVKIAPRETETGYDAPAPISTALLQYKKLPDGTWTTFKTLTTINWTMDFTKPVQLFGPNIFDPAGAVENDEYLIRLYFTDGIYENADLGVNAPEGGDTTWRNQWVTKITISGKRRPQ